MTSLEGNKAQLDQVLALAGMALVFVGLVTVGPWSLDAYGLAKMLPMTLGVGLLAVIWFRNPVVPQSRVVRVCLVVLLATLVASTIAANSSTTAFHGSFRYFGFVSWMLMIVAAAGGAAVAAVLDRKVIRGLLATAAFICIGVVGATSFAEVLGVSPLTYNQTFSGRAQSVFGNPAIAGSMVLLLLPLAVLLPRSPVWRVTSGLIGIAALWMSGTRSVWLGVVAAGAFVGWAYFERRLLRVVGALVAILAVAVASTGRWATVVADAEGRIELWTVGLRALQASPLVGYGPDGFGSVYGQFLSPGDAVALDRAQVVDRAHQAAIDSALAVGLIGALMVVVLWVAVGLLAIRAARSEDSLLLGLAAGLIGYLVHQQLFFPVVTVDVIFWVLVGVLATLGGGSVPVALPRAVAVVVPLAVLPALWSFGSATVADFYDARAVDARIAVEALDAYETANAIRPDMPQRSVLVATRFTTVGDPDVVLRAIRILEGQVAVVPQDPIIPLSLATLRGWYHELTGSDVVLAQIVDDMQAILDRDPLHGEAHLKIGTAYYRLDDLEGARVHWERAQALLPGSDAPGANLAVLEETR